MSNLLYPMELFRFGGLFLHNEFHYVKSALVALNNIMSMYPCLINMLSAMMLNWFLWRRCLPDTDARFHKISNNQKI